MSLYAALDTTKYVNEQWRDNAESLYETVAFRNVIGADKRLQTSGVAFARKHHLTVLHAKNMARRRVLNSLSREEWPNQLRVLTMPGLEWTFEKLLMSERDYALFGDGWMSPSGGRFVGANQKTIFYGVEYDPAI